MSKNENNDGGPAFPSQEMSQSVAAAAIQPGMSLRDYFAAQVLTGWLVSRESDVLLAKCGDDAEEAAYQAATAAYVVSDAMLSARKGTHP